MKLCGSAQNKEQREGVRRADETPIPFLPTPPPSHSPLPTSPQFFAHPRRAPSLAC